MGVCLSTLIWEAKLWVWFQNLEDQRCGQCWAYAKKTTLNNRLWTIGIGTRQFIQDIIEGPRQLIHYIIQHHPIVYRGSQFRPMSWKKCCIFLLPPQIRGKKTVKCSFWQPAKRGALEFRQIVTLIYSLTRDICLSYSQQDSFISTTKPITGCFFQNLKVETDSFSQNFMVATKIFRNVPRWLCIVQPHWTMHDFVVLNGVPPKPAATPKIPAGFSPGWPTAPWNSRSPEIGCHGRRKEGTSTPWHWHAGPCCSVNPVVASEYHWAMAWWVKSGQVPSQEVIIWIIGFDEYVTSIRTTDIQRLKYLRHFSG